MGLNFVDAGSRCLGFSSSEAFISTGGDDTEKIEVFREGGGAHLSVEGDKLGARGAAEGVGT